MAKSKKILSGTGWSFEPGGASAPAERESLPPDKQKAKVKVEKRPKGKIATVVTGFILSNADAKALSATLKKRCGTGGSGDADSIEVQGDHKEIVTTELTRLGWSVK